MPANPSVVENVVCLGCGCACDDIRLHLDGPRLRAAENACHLGQAWFAALPHDDQPAALLDGHPASLESAVERAAHLLRAARYPLIFGLTGLTNEAQRLAVALADRLGATLDIAPADQAGPPGIAFLGTGLSTATLGEVRNRADLIIYWGGDPAEAYPRLFERYAVEPRGLFVPHGRPDRTVVRVGQRGAPAGEADLSFALEPGTDFEVLWALRALVQGKPVDPRLEHETGVSLAALAHFVERLQHCTYGALLFDLRLAATRGGHFNTGAALALVTALNAFTHFVLIPLRGDGNVNGAENVLAWQTGYASAVNFAAGYPRHSPGEFSALGVLERADADAALLLNAAALPGLPPAARAHLSRIPTVVLNPSAAPLEPPPAVAITTATAGLHTGGTVFRMDNVALTLRPALPSPFATTEDVLQAMLARLEQ